MVQDDHASHVAVGSFVDDVGFLDLVSTRFVKSELGQTASHANLRIDDTMPCD